MSDESSGARGCLLVVGLALVSVAVGLALEPWAGFAVMGCALVLGAACGGADGRG